MFQRSGLLNLCWFYSTLLAILGGARVELMATTIHPELIESHITNPLMVREISKFRSGAGHDFSYDAGFTYGGEYFGATDSTEPASSMKHYYAPFSEFSGNQTTIPIYAPFDGQITRVTEEVDDDDSSIVNKRIEITSAANPDYTAILFHVNLDNDYPQIINDWPAALWPLHQPDDPSYVTDTVVAGDLLGYADMRTSNDFDVAILFAATVTEKYWVSIYDLMPDLLFEHYENRGAIRSQMKISKADRAANPITWWGSRNDGDWIMLMQVPEVASWGMLAVGLLTVLFAALRFSR